ncbi:hypothetical protein EAG_06379 [Camponotus floridanus]|uniref:Uncharacterized protein n=1 Tax=Camponotus floridanus TaxID=104421 RepID=E2A2C7_CAMFO|nr:hypothetical protein EAG_06379 [Camponotus floridanus]
MQRDISRRSPRSSERRTNQVSMEQRPSVLQRIFIVNHAALYRGHTEGGLRSLGQGLLVPRSYRRLPFPPNRRDHKSYDRQGTTHSRHFAFHPISTERKTHESLRFLPQSATHRTAAEHLTVDTTLGLTAEIQQLFHAVSRETQPVFCGLQSNHHALINFVSMKK